MVCTWDCIDLLWPLVLASVTSLNIGWLVNELTGFTWSLRPVNTPKPFSSLLLSILSLRGPTSRNYSQLTYPSFSLKIIMHIREGLKETIIWGSRILEGNLYHLAIVLAVAVSAIKGTSTTWPGFMDWIPNSLLPMLNTALLISLYVSLYFSQTSWLPSFLCICSYSPWPLGFMQSPLALPPNSLPALLGSCFTINSLPGMVLPAWPWPPDVLA